MWYTNIHVIYKYNLYIYLLLNLDPIQYTYCLSNYEVFLADSNFNPSRVYMRTKTSAFGHWSPANLPNPLVSETSAAGRGGVGDFHKIFRIMKEQLLKNTKIPLATVVDMVFDTLNPFL